MNTKQIIAELRRSAHPRRNPWQIRSEEAFVIAQGWKLDSEFFGDVSLQDIRTFYLLVAEAIGST